MLDAGAEEVNDLDDAFEVICEPTDLVAVRTALQDAGIDYDSPRRRSSRRSPCPSTSRAPAGAQARRRLEDSDDVQDVYTNIDIPGRDVAAQLDEE